MLKLIKVNNVKNVLDDLELENWFNDHSDLMNFLFW